MTLTAFLKALKSKNVNVTVLDGNEDVVCKFEADGIDALADDLEAREVSLWKITSASTITVVIADAP